jgi:hypothetical protein
MFDWQFSQLTVVHVIAALAASGINKTASVWHAIGNFNNQKISLL